MPLPSERHSRPTPLGRPKVQTPQRAPEDISAVEIAALRHSRLRESAGVRGRAAPNHTNPAAARRSSLPPSRVANSLTDGKVRLEHPAAGRSPVRLICPDQRRLSQDVAAHGLLKLSFCRRRREVELLVKGVKLEEIAVASGRRSGTAVARAPPVVQPLAGSAGRVLTPSERLVVDGGMLNSTQ